MPIKPVTTKLQLLISCYPLFPFKQYKNVTMKIYWYSLTCISVVGRGFLTPLFYEDPHYIACPPLFSRFCPTPLPHHLQPPPPLLFLLPCFFGWMLVSLDYVKSAHVRNVKILVFKYLLRILTKERNNHSLLPQILWGASEKRKNSKSDELSFASFHAFTWKF